ncbi:hypothetical protein OSTOST_10256 [Ostertagia ostertagi]
MNGCIRRYYATPLWPLEQADSSQSRCPDESSLQPPENTVNSQSQRAGDEESSSLGRSHLPNSASLPSVKVTMGRPIHTVRLSAAPVSTTTHDHQHCREPKNCSSGISHAFSNGMSRDELLLANCILEVLRLRSSLDELQIGDTKPFFAAQKWMVKMLFIDEHGSSSDLVTPLCFRLYTMYVDRKRLCVICGDSRDEREMRSASATKVQNAILLACLSACGGLKKTVDAKTVYDECHVNRRFLCHPHYVLAAQFIAAEMESVGKQFQHFEDPQASGSTAYVGMSEIPSHVVKFVNDFMSAANASSSSCESHD